VHAPARREYGSRPQRLERLTEEDRSRSRAPDDQVAREASLAEPVHHGSRTQAVERPAEEVELETRSPRSRARELTETRSLELLLTGLALAQMRFQRDPLGEPDVRIKELREIFASVLAVHGNRRPQRQYSPWMILEKSPKGSNLRSHG
jgi:hypothetical protein